MATKKLYESGSLVESKTSRGTWPIRIITEGKGSSGVYSRELLESYKDVFANRPMFGNHPTDPSKPWQRSPFDIKAKMGPNIEAREVDGVLGLYGEAFVSEEVDKWLTEFHDIVGVSIYASGEGSDRDGEYHVESFDFADSYTSIDFVVAPGRGGGVEARVAEAQRELETSVSAENDGTAPAAAAGKQGEHNMDEKILSLLESFITDVTSKFEEMGAKIDQVTVLAESVKDAQPDRVEAVDAAGELAVAVAEAKLGEKAVARVLESVKGGSTVADAVKHEKEIRDEVLAEAKSAPVDGYIVESAGARKGRLSDSATYKVGE